MFLKLASLVVAGTIGVGAHNVATVPSTGERATIVQPSTVVSNVAPAGADVTLIPSASAPSFPRTKHEKQNTACKNARTQEHYVGEFVFREEIRHHASKYWSGADLDVAVAITIPEGQRDLYCIGDETKQYYGKPTNDGRHWGESIGIFQYRTIIEQKGKGGCDDIDWQKGNIERQVGCANQKFLAKFPSGKQRRWTPWATYTAPTSSIRNYKRYLGA